jgi:undecaprenyl-diphosphatase
MHNSELNVLWFFNKTLAASWLDPIMIGLTNVWWWMPVYVAAVVFLVWKYKWYGIRLVLGAIIVVIVSDQIGNQIFKPLIDRLRPCTIINGQYIVSWIRLPSGPRLGLSFPSSHAMNNFAVATFFVTIFNNERKLRLLFVAALLISVSRLYLGLHYPMDVVGGALIGMAFGFTLAAVSEFIEERIRRRGMPSIAAETERREKQELGARGPDSFPWNKLTEEVETKEKSTIK